MFFLLLAVHGLSQELCFNYLDDDGDGFIDHFDDDCCELHNQPYYPCLDSCEEYSSTKLNDIDKIFAYPNWHEYSSPIICDLDNDGRFEIIGKPGPFNPRVRPVKDLLVLDAETGSLKQRIITGYYNYSTQPYAVKDILGDSEKEIIVLTDANNVSNNMRLECYSNDGALVWRSVVEYGYSPRYSWSIPLIEDLDENGSQEIIVGNQVFSGTTGQLLASGGVSSNHGLQVTDIGATTCPAVYDVLPDQFCSDCEGKEIIAGSTIYSFSETTNKLQIVYTFDQNQNGDGISAIADFDLDGIFDVVFITSKNNSVQLTAYNPVLNKSLFNPVNISTFPSSCCANKASIPAIGNILGDDCPEIVVTTSKQIRIFEVRGSTLDLALEIGTTDDSGQTPVSLYDIESDGEYELLYKDQDYIHIYASSSGLITRIPCTSYTGTESITISDVDQNGMADIFCSCRNGLNRFELKTTDPKLIGKFWPQYTYSYIKFFDDGKVVKHQRFQNLNNKSYYNTWLAQPSLFYKDKVLLPQFSITQPDCEDTLGTLVINIMPGYKAYIDDSIEYNSNSIVQLSQGEYDITIYDIDNCNIDTTIKVNSYFNTVNVQFPDTIILLEGEEYQIRNSSASSQNYSYNWIGNNLSCLTCSSPTFSSKRKLICLCNH